jgi:hypothetical protein
MVRLCVWVFVIVSRLNTKGMYTTVTYHAEIPLLPPLCSDDESLVLLEQPLFDLRFRSRSTSYEKVRFERYRRFETTTIVLDEIKVDGCFPARMTIRLEQSLYGVKFESAP